MFSSRSSWLLLACLCATAAQAREYPGIGRPATAAEIAAWDIDVRPDFKGLPKGSGTVAQGQVVWEAQCASCHGIFGESNSVFAPLVGGTTAEDVKSGRVARLRDPAYPGRTMLMKLATVSSLWDYINRAMPWNAPKSLKVDEVYAVTAYLLQLGGVVGEDFVLSERNIATAQQRLPNRNGMGAAHALWPGARLPVSRPDVQAQACMSNCAAEPKLASTIPDYARNAHGNLAEQNRMVGAQRGADTSRPGAVLAVTGPPAAPPSAASATAAATALALTGKHNCTACHNLEGSLVGPSFRDAGRKHGGRPDALEYLAEKIRSGGSGVWGGVPMPPQSLSESDALSIAQWIADGARR